MIFLCSYPASDSSISPNGYATAATDSSTANVAVAECITKMCSQKASADTSYLCNSCYQQTNHTSAATPNSTTDVNMSPSAGLKTKNANASSVERKRFSNLAEPEATDSLDGSSDEQFESPPRTKAAAAAHVTSGMTRQNTLIDAGRSKFYTLTNEVHQVAETSPLLNRRVRSISDGAAQLSSSSGALNNQSGVSHMNNAECIQHERNPTRLSAPPTTSSESNGVHLQLANSQFYVDSSGRASSMRCMRSSRVLRTVNNLHNEWQEKVNVNQAQKNYVKHAPLGKEYTNEMSSAVRRSNHNVNGVAVATNGVDECSSYAKPQDTTRHDNLTDRVPAKGSSLKRPCQQSGCPYFGSIATDFYCSACFKTLNKKLAMNVASQLK